MDVSLLTVAGGGLIHLEFVLELEAGTSAESTPGKKESCCNV